MERIALNGSVGEGAKMNIGALRRMVHGFTAPCWEPGKYGCALTFEEWSAAEDQLQEIETRGLKLEGLCRELIEILETVEITDEGREFHPTTINSCRVLTCERLGKIIPEIKRLSKIED